MSFASTIPFTSFWSSPWSRSLRAACVWLKRTPAPVVPDTPDRLAPGWLRPLCLHRQIGWAIGARLAWQRAHPDLAALRFPIDSTPCWTEIAWQPYPRRILRVMTDEWLLSFWLVELERLQRIIETPPELIGERWTRAALGCGEHLTQVYTEFKRRYKARPTRQFIGTLLQDYICWRCPDEVV